MDKVAKSLHIGNEQIIKAICDLPKTLHDIVGAPDKFCVDAWPVVHGDTTNLFISMHGQFSECEFSHLTVSEYGGFGVFVLTT